MEYPKFKVTVSCMTYNHSKYITDAMNGFTMQQTSFPFVCTIVDDASTDGEQEVIRKYVEDNFDLSEASVAFQKETDYAHITYAQHKTNKNCFFAVLYLKENNYSHKKDKSRYLNEWREGVAYMALCEGDDYWIVPDKLQKQVQALDEYTGIDICAHAQYFYFAGTKSKVKEKTLGFEKKVFPVEDVILGEGEYVGTNTLMIRMTCERNIPRFRKMMNYDYTIQMHGALHGGLLYLPEFMSVYSVGVPGSFCTTHKGDKEFAKKYIEQKLEMLNQLDEDTNYNYTVVIKARKLLYTINLNNNIYENFKFFLKYREGFRKLPIDMKIKVLIRLILPHALRLRLKLLEKRH